jgi:2-polyprenyl-3-methyl-5-hydroxy-6-metoxy-1,4-benzoquinol methylase
MDNKQHFDIKLEDIVPEYYSSNKYIRQIFFERFKIAIFYLKKINAKRILDAGCGDGLFTSKISNLKGISKVIGVDFNIHTEKLNKKY